MGSVLWRSMYHAIYNAIFVLDWKSARDEMESVSHIFNSLLVPFILDD